MRLLFKTLSYSIMHVCVATTVAYVLTGNLFLAISIGLIEPIVQTFAYAGHEWIWDQKLRFDHTKNTQTSSS